jgi:hypothetical protein
VYASRVDNRKLTFAVSGMLWQRSLVMVDKETDSLWSHLLGECMRGELKSRELEMLPSVMTDWKSWKSQHPDSTVLMMSRTSKNYDRDFYRDPTRFVVGMVSGEKARAWPFDQLLKQAIVNDRFGGESVLITFETESNTPRVFDRRLDGKDLSFQLTNGKLVDDQTGSQWSLSNGKAVSGQLSGSSLRPLIGIPSYRRAWENFHPDSEYWKAE